MGSHGRMLTVICLVSLTAGVQALLYPRDSPTRSSKSLDGVWSLKLTPKADQDAGFRESWFSKPLTSLGDVLEMPVPASYNDITTNSTIRDYVGWAWYSTQFYVDPRWEGSRVVIRLGSVHYNAIVYINGEFVTEHSGGHLPFEADVSDVLKYSAKNLVSVAVNNTLTRYTVPQGEVRWRSENEGYPPGYTTLDYNFDFFNYAGIHRPVILYTTPQKIYINDVTTMTKVGQDLSAEFSFNVSYFLKNEEKENIKCVVQLLGEDDVVSESFSCSDSLHLTSPKLWWPYLMSEAPGYMYQLRITVISIKHGMDEYTLPVGLREVTWGDSSFMINHQPFYFRGFGRHEDSNIRGKGLDLPLVARDYNLIKWMGANSYRTSHYPYADELMDFADRNGIVIIDECPAVALDHFEAPLLAHHLSVMTDLVGRDKNHPSVVMWSVGNEPKSYRSNAGKYFKRVTEYGADTVVGLHMEPAMVFTEEYQVQLIRENFKAFDQARAEGWFIGEHIWNFADFMTKQEPRRVAGNKKGIFTRERQPKLAAHVLRARYWRLATLLEARQPRNLSDSLLFS